MRSAYTARVDEYVEVCGRIELTAKADQTLILDWARGLPDVGPVLDVGCGPGQWTYFLDTNGIDVEGIDPVRAFIEHARATYPATRYRIGRADDLGAPDATASGVLAWYSLIHTLPEAIDSPLAEFARVIVPGGGLALGFFTGPQLEPFDHRVTTAYFWPVDLLAAHVEAAGFATTQTATRTDPGVRPHAEILAVRRY